MRIQTALNRFRRQLEADGRSVHTIKQYERHVSLLARWCADVRHSGKIGALKHEHLAKFLDHEPWHSLMVDTDLTVALAMYESLAIREDNLPWYEVSPNLVRITARVLDQANAEHLQRFAGELQTLHDRHAGELPQEVAELVRYLVASAAQRLGIEPPSIAS